MAQGEEIGGCQGCGGEQTVSWAGGLHGVGASLLRPGCRLEVHSAAPDAREKYHSRLA